MNIEPETVEQFEARGGRVQHIPRGAMTEAGWKPEDYNPASPEGKDREFRRAQARADRLRAMEDERKAKKQAAAIQPAPRHRERKPAKPETPKRRPGPPKGKFTRMTPQAKELLELLPWHPTIPLLAKATGKSRNCLWLNLNLLRKKGLVESDGKARVLTTWRVVANAPAR